MGAMSDRRLFPVKVYRWLVAHVLRIRIERTVEMIDTTHTQCGRKVLDTFGQALKSNTRCIPDLWRFAS